MILFVEIIGILFMFTMMFIMIWSFVILNKVFGQMRYKNYLLEKINQSIILLGSKSVDISKEIAPEKKDAEEDMPEEEQAYNSQAIEKEI